MRVQIRKVAAFTLVEVMVAVAIVGMLAGISVPNALRARENAQLKRVLNNLRLIQQSKSQWAFDTRRGTMEVPTEADLAGYFSGNAVPAPVVGESYTYNDVATPTTATTPVKLGTIPAGGAISLD
jgi:prepilin-type N-terminal cleavage/methylation domain-containing protein